MGIGLITWESEDNTFTNVCYPKEVGIIWNAQKKSVISYIKNQRRENNDDR